MIEFLINSVFALGVLASVSAAIGLVLGIAGYIDAQRGGQREEVEP